MAIHHNLLELEILQWSTEIPFHSILNINNNNSNNSIFSSNESLGFSTSTLETESEMVQQVICQIRLRTLSCLHSW
jgi:hypothetical protein